MIQALPSAFLGAPIAHRALHDVTAGRPENSRAAVQAAIDAGYGIEIDLQLSADGVAIVFHDDDLDRLTEAVGPVRARTAEALAQIPLRHGHEGLPSFAEILAQVAGQVPLLVELKDQTPDDGALEVAAARDLVGYAGPVAVMSFNPRMVGHMADLAPDVPRGLTTCAFDPDEFPVPEAVGAHLRDIADFDAVGACFISHHAIDLDRPRVQALRAAGVPVLCWTIRSAQAEATARKRADNVTFEGYSAALA